MPSRLHELRAILEEEAGGPPGQLLRLVLRPAGWLTAAAARLRRRLYAGGWAAARLLPAPVISVGNLTAGGTGKTPAVAWLARRLLAQGRSVAVVARGYGARDGEPNEEQLLLREEAPGILLASRKDRDAAALAALDRGADCLILDDGFQRLSLARDLDIVLLDATAPFGGGRCLPAGLLREPLRALRAADLLVLTRADQAEPGSLDALRARLRLLAPETPVAVAEHRPHALTGLHGEPAALDDLRRTPVALLAGLGRPQSFLRTVRDLGAEAAHASFFDDHHAYTPAEIRTVRARAREAGAKLLLTTAKDAVKLRQLSLDDEAPPWRVLHVRFTITEGEELLQEALQAACPPPPRDGDADASQ
jgi:tetraacyldisaccharide 4'-kinase